MFIERLPAAFLVSAWLAFTAQPAQAVTILTATLTGAQEAPGPGDDTASGTATLTLNDAQDRLEITIQIVGLDLDAAQTPGMRTTTSGPRTSTPGRPVSRVRWCGASSASPTTT